MILGHLNSIESLSTQDGPGLRTVIFMQGCSLRCKYCHNPDAWAVDGGETISSGELARQIGRLTPYLKGEGGVTLSGGEPLMQPEFMLELLYNLKKMGLHTTVDTSGWQSKYSNGGTGSGTRVASDRLLAAILAQIDLLMVDVKAPAEDDYLDLTGRPALGRDVLLDNAISHNKKVWLRHVVIPEYNDTDQDIADLAEWTSGWIRRGLNPEQLTLIPYHRMGLQKYEELGIKPVWLNKPALDHTELEQYALQLVQKLAEIYPEARIPFRVEF